MQHLLFAIIFLSLIPGAYAAPADEARDCEATDRACLMTEIETLSRHVDHAAWKDETLRELAKTYAYDGQTDKAIALINDIKSDDTKAMTIRGIGMAAATGKWEESRYAPLFASLKKQAEGIEAAPSKEIAYTYIAMSQAAAGLSLSGRETASSIKNAALKNKAYGEIAEIDAKRGDLENTLSSMTGIDSPPFRDKQYDIVSGIFLDKAMIREAYACAGKIDNAYLKAKSIQRILNKGKAEEQDLEPEADLTKGR